MSGKVVCRFLLFHDKRVVSLNRNFVSLSMLFVKLLKVCTFFAFMFWWYASSSNCTLLLYIMIKQCTSDKQFRYFIKMVFTSGISPVCFFTAQWRAYR